MFYYRAQTLIKKAHLILANNTRAGYRQQKPHSNKTGI